MQIASHCSAASATRPRGVIASQGRTPHFSTHAWRLLLHAEGLQQRLLVFVSECSVRLLRSPSCAGALIVDLSAHVCPNN